MKKAFSKKNLWEGLPPAIKSTVGRLAGLVPPEFLLGRKFQQQQALVRGADFWGLERNKQYQLEQVKSVCKLAYDKTSFYKDAFDRVNFNPKNMTSLEELDVLPFIDKHDLNNRTDELLTCSLDENGVDYVATGGSSGEPFRFYIGADRSAVEFAYLSNSWSRVGYELSTKQAAFRGAVTGVDRVGMNHYFDPLLRRHYYSNFYMDDKSVGEYFEHIATIGSCYLHIYPSSLNVLVRYLIRNNEKPPQNIKGLLVGSENVHEDDRQLAEKIFGVRYFSWYGHSEKLVFAAECEKSNYYHVYPTYGYCELVDEQGRRVTVPGQTGEIVGTGFINKVMPFIRYRTGDFATYVADHCEHCGRNHMVIKDIRGHNTQEMLVAKDSSLIPWSAVNMHDDTFEAVQQFQFQQSEIGKGVLHVIAGGAKKLDVEKIKLHLNAKLQRRIEFEVEAVDKIPLTARGKSIFVNQKIDISKL